MSVPNVGRAGMRSDNPTGAGDQQERSGIEQWIVGFVDGEVASASRSSGPGLQARVAGAAPLRGRAGPAERGGPVDDPAVLRLWRSAGTGGTTTEDLFAYGVPRFQDLRDRIVRPSNGIHWSRRRPMGSRGSRRSSG